MAENILDISTRQEFRKWLSENCTREKECWVQAKRGRPTDDKQLWYLDAVEEALCFGWIDSTLGIVDGRRMQRFSPRKKNSSWTELNKQRVRRLQALGLMTEHGEKVLPEMRKQSFQIDVEIAGQLKKARVWSRFNSFPKLYQRVRAYNLAAMRKRDREGYEKALERLIKETRNGRMYGEWNDYGRLPED